MDSSISLKDQIWFLRLCHHISNVLYYYTVRGAVISFQGRWMGEVQRSTSLRDHQIWDTVTFFLWDNGRIAVCGCTGQVCQIRRTSRLLQVSKEELLRCIGWNRLPARRLTMHERSLLDTFATRNYLRFYFHVLLFVKRLRSFDMAWSPGVMFCVRCIYSCP